MRSRRIPLLVGLLVALLTFVVFSPTLQYPFVNWDDNIYVYQNPRLHPLAFDNLLSFFTTPYFRSWTPVAMLSHAADVAVYGLNPFGHHLTNVLLHSANAALVFWIALRLIQAFKRSVADGGDTLPSSVISGSVMAALVFALHPLRAESVAWVSDRKDLLCAFFMLLTSLVYLMRRESTAPSPRGFVLLLLLYALALGSKSIAMMLPVALLLLDGMLYRRRLASSVKELWPLFLLAAGAGLMAKLAAPDLAREFIVGDKSTLQLFSFPFAAILFYVKMTVFPENLSPVYHTNAFLPAAESVLLCVAPAVVVGVSICCIVEWRRGRPYWLAGWSLFILFLLPTFLGMWSGIQPVADRYTYFASISLSVLVGGAVERLFRPSGREIFSLRSRIALAASVLLLSFLSYKTMHQIKVWKDPTTLWTYVLQRAPFPLAYNNLGMILLDQKKPAEAIALFNKAIELRPSYGEAMCNRGIAFNAMGETAKAIESYREAIRMQADHLDSYINLGTEYLNKGDVDSAITIYRRALAVDSTFSPAHYNIALALMTQQKYAEAIIEHRSALAIMPRDADAWYNLGVAYEHVSRAGEAIESYTNAIACRQDYLDAYINLGNLHATQGNPDKALETFGKAIRVNPHAADIFYNLGHVLYSVGEIDRAVSSFEEAVRIDSSYGPAYHHLGLILAQHGDSSRAVSLLQQGARLGVEDSRRLLQQRGINW